MTAYTFPLIERYTALSSSLDRKYCRSYGQDRPYMDYLVNGQIDPHTSEMFCNGSNFEDRYFYVIDLTQDNLKRNIRKSYKSLVNKQDGIVFSPSILGLKKLHHKVAGRKTRSDETWAIQQEMIANGEGFVVELYKDGTLIAAAFFQYNKWCCYYAVAASLSGVNSHPVIWAAIEYCQEEGLKRFELGEKIDIDEKNKNISNFKAGFGGKLERRLVEKGKE